MSENCNHGNNDGEVIIDVKNLHKNYGHMEVIKASILRYARAR